MTTAARSPEVPPAGAPVPLCALPGTRPPGPRGTLPPGVNMLDAALDLLRLGFRILPLHSPDPAHSSGCSCHKAECGKSAAKHPRINQWQHDASTDPVVIQRWWRTWPDANIGVATGGGLVVLDVDPRNDGDDSLEELENEHGEIVTLTSRTGGGGWHFYFRGALPPRDGFRSGLDLVVPAARQRLAELARGEGVS